MKSEVVEAMLRQMERKAGAKAAVGDHSVASGAAPLAEYIWMDGAIVPWNEARLHVFTPALRYGIGVFEGLRGYWNEQQGELYVFRLADHLERLAYSQRAMRLAGGPSSDAIAEAMLALLRANAFRESVHIRINLYLAGQGEMDAAGPLSLVITAVPRPTPQRVWDGCRVQVSSWQRLGDRAMPPRIKTVGNYGNSRLAQAQAAADGYDAALLLNQRGFVAEGPGMAFFMVRKGTLVTPSISSDILESITRATILELAQDDLAIPAVERDIERSELHAASEMFFCGTGWEVTPIVALDGLPVGDGLVGPMTRRLRDNYLDVAQGRLPDSRGWLTPLSL